MMITAKDYFRETHEYFWQFEESSNVIAIPQGSTIAYRELIIEIIDKIGPVGLPSFGSLLLALIATNTNGNSSLAVVHAIVNSTISQNSHEKQLISPENTILSDAIEFLQLLSEVPPKYKEGKNRMLLLMAIFERAHNNISFKNSRQIIDSSKSTKFEELVSWPKRSFDINTYYQDFRPHALLKSRFHSVNDIISSIHSLPVLEENILLESTEKEEESKDLIDQLVIENKTFHIGALVKRIWSGLNIPVHSSLPSEQPLGGISDLTNKGDLDKLLISEYANEDILFLSRLANNEALYIRREIPPASNDQKRIILIDVSLKNWGTPKTIAFATMLAIAKHPKTDISCEVYALGETFHPISFDNVDGIISGLQILEGILHCGNGLNEFFKEFPANKNHEVFIISEPGTLKNPGMLKALNDHANSLSYYIYTEAEGDINIYKRQQKGKRHIQHLQLPLKELWKKAQIKAKPSRLVEQKFDTYPLLFKNSTNMKILMSTSNGDVYQITSDKSLLRFYDNSVKQYEKGWDLIYKELPFHIGEFEMGLCSNGDLILLMYNPNKKELTLLNIDTNEKVNVQTAWKTVPPNSFIFLNDQFYLQAHHLVYGIDLKGKIQTDSSVTDESFISLRKHRKELRQNYSYLQSLFKNINKVFINDAGNLVFNIHELKLNTRKHIKIDPTAFRTPIMDAILNTEKNYIFPDGSCVEIARYGLIILKSSDLTIPTIFIPSVLDSSLGVATEEHFAGNLYFMKHQQHNLFLLDHCGKPLAVVKILKEMLDISLAEAKRMVDDCPSMVMRNAPLSKINPMLKQLESAGAKVEVKPINGNEIEMTAITTEVFYSTYITPFIQTILDNGTKN